MPDMEAETVTKIVVEEVVTRFCVPLTVNSDQCVQDESKLFVEMCRLPGIKKTHTTPYHLKSNGMVERCNRNLLKMLSAYVQEHQRHWDDHLPYFLMAYRSTEQETTRFTPNMLMLG